MIRNLIVIGLLGLSTTTFAADELDLDTDNDFPSEADQLDDIDELPEVAKKKARKVVVEEEEEEEEMSIDMSGVKKAPTVVETNSLDFELPEEKEELIDTEKAEVVPVKETPKAAANFTINLDEEEEEEEEEVRRPVKKQPKEKDIEFDINIDD